MTAHGAPRDGMRADRDMRTPEGLAFLLPA
jgi:hypothetical protein